jgi:hypothetical protein
VEVNNILSEEFVWTKKVSGSNVKKKAAASITPQRARFCCGFKESTDLGPFIIFRRAVCLSMVV